jgi:hypothetical protein
MSEQSDCFFSSKWAIFQLLSYQEQVTFNEMIDNDIRSLLDQHA